MTDLQHTTFFFFYIFQKCENFWNCNITVYYHHIDLILTNGKLFTHLEILQFQLQSICKLIMMQISSVTKPNELPRCLLSTYSWCHPSHGTSSATTTFAVMLPLCYHLAKLLDSLIKIKMYTHKWQKINTYRHL